MSYKEFISIFLGGLLCVLILFALGFRQFKVVERRKIAEGTVLVTEKDGCKVYKAYADRTIFFTTCKGEVQYQENCGKNCSRTVTVPTGVVR